MVMKKPFAALTTAVLAASIALPTADVAHASATLNDIDNSYAKESILNLVELGIINGYQGQFNPQGKINRQDFAIILAKALSLDVTQAPATATFTDVPTTNYAFAYVEAAVKAGLVQGVGNGSFGTGSTLSRQDMAVLFVRALDYTGNIPIDFKPSILTFSDANQISYYARDSVAAAVELGLINGNGNGSFDPKGVAERQAVALVTNKFIEKKYNVPIKEEEQVSTKPEEETPKPEAEKKESGPFIVTWPTPTPVDQTAPIVTGVTDQHSYNTAVLPVSADSDIKTVTLTRNEDLVIEYTLGTQIVEEGVYVLTVTDRLDNSTVIHFTIDMTAPSVTGIEDGAFYNDAVTPNPAQTDIAQVALTRNESVVSGYTLGTEITEEGSYVLTLTDKAGNVKSFDFVIDKTAPIVTGVTNNGFYKTTVTPDSAATISSVTLKRNESSVAGYALGTEVSEEGVYVLEAADIAGNKTTVNFTIDKTLPVVTGVSDSGLYNTGVTATVTEANVDMVEIKKDSEASVAYESGTSITAEGVYVLKVTDKAGNSTTVHFTIDRTAPVVTGVVNNGVYSNPVTLTWADTDISSFGLTYNGDTVGGFAKGQEFSGLGDYILTVADHAGNVTTISFEIIEGP